MTLICKHGFVKGEVFCFRYLDFYFWHGESISTASQLTSTASQKSQDLNKVPLLLQNLVCKSLGIWDGIVKPIYGCGVKITPDINPMYAGLKRSCQSIKNHMLW